MKVFTTINSNNFGNAILTRLATSVYEEDIWSWYTKYYHAVDSSYNLILPR